MSEIDRCPFCNFEEIGSWILNKDIKICLRCRTRWDNENPTIYQEWRDIIIGG